MKKLINKGFDKMPTVYRAGIVNNIVRTASGHVYIEVKNIRRVNIVKEQRTYEYMYANGGFLVPKRREQLSKDCLRLQQDQDVIFKLQKESISGKYCVSEIFE